MNNFIIGQFAVSVILMFTMAFSLKSERGGPEDSVLSVCGIVWLVALVTGVGAMFIFKDPSLLIISTIVCAFLPVMPIIVGEGA